MALTFKVVIIGQGGTGKTSLCIRVTQDKFSLDYRLTIGTGFFTHKVATSNSEIFLQIWDFAGQDQFKGVLDSFTKGAKGVLMTFDLTNLESFIALEGVWIPFIKKNLPDSPIYLIGTKMDLEANREVDDFLIEELRGKYDFVFYLPTSSKTGQNVGDVFQEVAEHLAKTI